MKAKESQGYIVGSEQGETEYIPWRMLPGAWGRNLGVDVEVEQSETQLSLGENQVSNPADPLAEKPTDPNAGQFGMI